MAHGPSFASHTPHFGNGGGKFSHLPSHLLPGALIGAASVGIADDVAATDVAPVAPVDVVGVPVVDTVPAAVPVPVDVAAPVPTRVPVQAATPVRTAALAAAPKPSAGSFVAVAFVPTITAADITTFLKAYNVTLVDGPNANGSYRIRLSTDTLPSDEMQRVIDSMRSQTAMVTSVDAG